MTSVPHEPSRLVELLRISDLWAALAIVSMWLAVLFDAIYGPSIVSTTPGGSSSTVPSAVPVALFASLATWAVARYGFRRDPR
jgi:hypothetical protein